MRHRSSALLTAIGVLALVAVSSPGFARELTIDERVAYQRAIEQVYWNHRVWPPENPAPKPPLSSVMRDAALRAKVEDYLKKSNALAKHWQRPITAEQLQAEMDRMARDTRDGATLNELFHALNDDPYVIAETLARQTLVDRLIHNWYSVDTRFHGAVKAKAEAAIASCESVDCMRSMNGRYQPTHFELRDADTEAATESADDPTVTLELEEWQDHLGALARRFQATAESLPTNRLSGLEETRDAFVVTAILDRKEGEITTASVVWPKRSFESWWEAEALGVGSEIAPSTTSSATTSVPSPECADDAWSAIGFEVPGARRLHTAVWTGTEMIVWGGQAGSAFLDTGGRYNPAIDTWTVTSTGANVPSAREVHTAVWTGTEMIVWGGHNSSYLNTGGRYDPTTDKWIGTSTGSNVPSVRWTHTAVWTGTEMIVWGGSDASYLNTGGRYEPATDTWAPTSTGANVPAASTWHSAVWTGTEMIVWGGEVGGNPNTYTNSGGRYDPSTDAWTAISTGVNVPAGRRYHTAVWTGEIMIVWGGHNGSSSLNTGGRYDPAADSWTATSTGTSVPARRSSLAAVWTSAQMIVWGGQGATGYLNSGGRYDPTTDTWTATSTGANVPTARSSPTAVWTGTEMIAWGGGTNVVPNLNTGGRYDPTRDTWTATPTGVEYGSRIGHRTVWTGTEMIVWGGQGAASYLNSGGRYEPVTNTWTATSTGANVPAGRRYHTAVWTGTEMIVWGGGNGTSLNTGGRYDPTTNTWAVSSAAANVPAARTGHTAVWTGTEMIIWGGFGGSFLNTGGRYNPAMDTWTATSTMPNVPSARFLHTAVWTGTEMITWGGSGGGLKNSGGRYNPTMNTWTPTATGAEVPSTRAYHIAVWTGTEMIVWGGLEGENPNIYTNTGGRYDPTTDTWAATSTGVNVPAARTLGTSVWTGTELIVWGGGGSSNNYLNTGGRYDNSTNTWKPTSTGANVPLARTAHSAVWTGRQMIVWGGDPITITTGGVYCTCPNGALGYRDADGDGFGNAGISLATCDGVLPAGYVAVGSDCDDADPSAWAAPSEVSRMTVTRSMSGPGFTDIEWPTLAHQVGPGVRYDIVAGSLSLLIDATRFADATCMASEVDGNSATVSRPDPAPASGDWFLVRAQNGCGTGTYDENNPAQIGSRDAQVGLSPLRCAP